jgi:hypothetical protein
MRELVENPHLRQRERAVEQTFLQYTDALRVKAIESTQRRDPRFAHCLVCRRWGHRIALPALGCGPSMPLSGD